MVLLAHLSVFFFLPVVSPSWPKFAAVVVVSVYKSLKSPQFTSFLVPGPDLCYSQVPLLCVYWPLYVVFPD